MGFRPWNCLIQVIWFYNHQSQTATSSQIPYDSCSRPQACSPYLICHEGNTCQCPLALARVNCNPQIGSACRRSNDNCTCLAMFFYKKSGYCYLFDHIGSFEDAKEGISIESYVKVLGTQFNTSQGRKNKKHSKQMVVVIVVVATIVIFGLVIMGIRYYKKNSSEVPDEFSEEDTFLENISGMPVRFSYKDLQHATNDFTKKLGQGGFGSVYQGVLQDATQVAVKRLEKIGQGTKEFRAEVSIIGSIHHHHLVRLKGFCAEGKHRLLVYEYMANGSLDRMIFGDFLLDWDTRYNIAIGMARGLAYLHEECTVKIIHCDIKPENILLDDNFLAKVSDFGLAKLMTREQSHVFTTLRGTQGYLATGWCYLISLVDGKTITRWRLPIFQHTLLR